MEDLNFSIFNKYEIRPGLFHVEFVREGDRIVVAELDTDHGEMVEESAIQQPDDEGAIQFLASLGQYYIIPGHSNSLRVGGLGSGARYKTADVLRQSLIQAGVPEPKIFHEFED